MNDTIIKQYVKSVHKECINEFYNFVFVLLNNLIKTNLEKNTKLILINNLMFEKCIIMFKNKDGEIQIGRMSRVLTYDENRLPIDIQVRMYNGKTYELIKGEYCMIYNPIAVDYLKMKIEEIGNIEKITEYLRKLYKVPYVIKSKDSKILSSIKDYIVRIFDYDTVCDVVSGKAFDDNTIEKIDLKTEYITDKLLEENESLKEDILEILGIYKNTSGNRERVNESELIVSNSLTTVNKLGIENALTDLITECNKLFDTNYTIELNINKIFESFKGGGNNE